MAAKLPANIKPMLGRLTREPFDSADHIFELKWDGMRALAFIEAGQLRLTSRTGRDITSQFPELADLPSLVKNDSVVIDGEIVCLDSNSRPSFPLLQQRIQSKKTGHPRANPAHFIAFDLLYIQGRSLMKESLIQRKARLQDLLTPTELVQPCEFIEAAGKAFFQATCDLGLEGIMAKAKSGLYHPGQRSPDWQKIKRIRESEFVIGGYSLTGTRKELFSSLLLGLYDEDQNLTYVGSVGTGFSQSETKQVYAELSSRHSDKRPFSSQPDVKRLLYWCRPELVCQVEYGEFTLDGKLRYPIYLRQRDDKTPIDCTCSDAPGWPRGDAILA